MAKIAGDFRALRSLKEQLRGMAKPDFGTSLGNRLGPVALRLIADGFRKESDPYGDKWRGLKFRKGKILQDTGRLKNSFSFKATPSGFTVSSAAAYASFHQDGTVNLDRRMMLPDPRAGLGARWEGPISREFSRFLNEWFKVKK